MRYIRAALIATVSPGWRIMAKFRRKRLQAVLNAIINKTGSDPLKSLDIAFAIKKNRKKKK